MAPKYSKLNLLGCGNFGRAWVVQLLHYKTKHVIKEIDLKHLSKRDIDQALVEVAALSKCKHENVIRYTEAFVDDIGILSIVMEYAPEGDLQKQILQRRGLHFPDQTTLIWFGQLLSAVAYIHSLGILHRDIKPQNIFLDEHLTLKLGDFGISKILESKSDVAVTVIGTPFYLSPEICLQKPYSFKSDMWAVGCVLYELCCLRVPFTGSNLPNLTMNIVAGVYDPIHSHCDKGVREMITQLLVSDPRKRPTAEQLLNSEPFMKVKRDLYGSDQTEHDCEIKPKTSKKKRRAVDCSEISKSYERINSDQKAINSVTYTVLRHPKLRRLSPSVSPEISQLLDRQRRSSPCRSGVEARQVQSDVACPRKQPHKQTSGPKLNLMKFAKMEASSHRVHPKIDDTRPGDISMDSVDKINKLIYDYQCLKLMSQKDLTTKLHNMLAILLGEDRLNHVITAVKCNLDYETFRNQLDVHPSLMSALLVYVRLLNKSVSVS